MMNNNTYVSEITGNPHTFSFGSDMAIYKEQFADGRLLCLGYDDNGIPKHTFPNQQNFTSFDLIIDGEALTFGWEYVNFTSKKENGVIRSLLLLRHTRKPVELDVCTDVCEFGFFRRHLRIRNMSKKHAMGLTKVTPLSGIVWNLDGLPVEKMQEYTESPFSAGHFRDFEWSNEGNFGWEDIQLNKEIAFSSELGCSGHSSPFFILRNNIFGGYFICQLAWSGNWRKSFLADIKDHVLKLRFAIGPEATPPMRMINPGETIRSPEVHFGISHEDFNGAIQNLHAHLRKNVLQKANNKTQPVIFNNWGYMKHEVSEDKLKQEIDIAKKVGAELFMIDAGWYGNIDKHWFLTTGDWNTGDRLPNDLFHVFDYARKKGLKCGLWVEIESAGNESKLALEHPDWFISRYGQKVERILDLTKSEVTNYVESTITQLIERYRLDMLRLDYNVKPMEGGFNMVKGCEENTLWRHVEAVYGIIERICQRFPDLQWENCASGGGRTDVGMLERATTTWVSDWMRMPRTVRILNGMSMAIPPEYINRLYGAGMGGYYGNVETQLQLLILSHPCLSGLAPSLSELNPALIECVKKYVNIYKNFIRPFHRECKVFHHTPEIPGVHGNGWCCLEYVSQDSKRAVAGIFRLMNAENNIFQFKFRGLEPSLLYQIVIEPGTCVDKLSGRELMGNGLKIHLDNALTSKLLMLTAE